MVHWLKTCSLNMEVKGGEKTKPSHLHLKLVGYVVYVSLNSEMLNLPSLA